ncbi:MAG: serine/threonine-protein kinase, partial [Actinomycetota bacterium]
MADQFGIPGLTRYEEIGSGGFASVYVAYEPDAGREVAVKVLRAADEQARRRFDRERRTLGRTTEHANIVTMFRSGFTENGGHPYLVMEYLPGGSLQDLLDRRARLPVDRAVALIAEVADALGFAHRAGILHKDVKPANILLSSTGSAKLGDFGISAVRDATGTSQMGFSLAYASPETFQASAGIDGRFIDRRDERSDLFSLAATLYAVIVGAAPFAADTQAAAMHRILTESPPPTGSPQLDRFFATAMAKDPANRFPNASSFVEALRTLAAGESGGDLMAAGGPPIDGRPTSILSDPPTDPPLLVSSPGVGLPATTPGHPGPAGGR